MLMYIAYINVCCVSSCCLDFHSSPFCYPSNKDGSEHPDLCGRIPVAHFWDQSEPRLFVCEAVLDPSQRSSDKKQQVTENVVHLSPTHLSL